ncbi:MAG: DUF4388 domain-containing protein [Planctomycetes bacterium]|nr:DUF4388 domain-containing protein [Planctomycetota bacterium]
MSPPGTTQRPAGERKDPSLEKTSPLDAAPPAAGARGPAAGVPQESGAPLPGVSTDAELLRRELEAKARECAALVQATEQLKAALEALRSDFAAQKSEGILEVRAIQDALGKAHSQAAQLQGEIADLRSSNKRLKLQTLSLQYHINLWGIPVASGDGTTDGQLEPQGIAGPFFPALTPLPGSSDPVPAALRGDLASFCFPDVLGFLASSSREGVLTVVTEGIVSKLYLERSCLKLAGWNDRDPDLALATLLEESGLVDPRALADLRARSLFDLEVAGILVGEKRAPAATVQAGLREHARVILGFLFHSTRGSFFFQPGQIPRKRELQFALPVTDVLLKTAAAMDERTRAAFHPPGVAEAAAGD